MFWSYFMASKENGKALKENVHSSENLKMDILPCIVKASRIK